MQVEVESVAAGHSATRTRYGGEVERIWVRPVVLHCTAIESGLALISATKLLPDADLPRRAPGGGWKVAVVARVRDSWETEDATGLRTAHEFDDLYEQERVRHADDVRPAATDGPLLLRLWRRL